VCVRDRQRIAALSVGGAEPALEVGAPDLVRRRRRQERPAPAQRVAAAGAAGSVPRGGADRRSCSSPARPPPAARSATSLATSSAPNADGAGGKATIGHCILQTMRRPTRRSRQVGQAADRVGAVASQPLVDGLAAYPIPLTERRHRQLAAQALGNEHHPFVHDAGLFPRHRQVPLPTMMTCYHVTG
jgi:hypothetical protein